MILDIFQIHLVIFPVQKRYHVTGQISGFHSLMILSIDPFTFRQMCDLSKDRKQSVLLYGFQDIIDAIITNRLLCICEIIVPAQNDKICLRQILLTYPSDQIDPRHPGHLDIRYNQIHLIFF